MLEEFGTTLLGVAAGEITYRSVEAIVIHDPLDQPESPRGALVLGVGVSDPAEVAQMLPRLGLSGAVALVVRSPFAATPEVAAAAAASGVAVLTLTRGTAWAHLAGLLRALMTPGDPDDARPVTFGGILAGDLFTVANAIAALLGFPVSIEDRYARLVAYSARHDGPEGRTSSGAVPPQYTRILEERGLFQEVSRSERPVLVSELVAEIDARTVLAVRAGEEVLGTIWVATDQPLSEEHLLALHDAAKLVAMHMVWQRTDADAERRRRAGLLRTALDGGTDAPEALQRLGLRDENMVVLALALIDPAAGEATGATPDATSPALLAAERKRVADAFAVHLGFAHPRAVTGLVGEVAYGVLPTEQDGSAVRLGTEFLARVRSTQRAVVGIGPISQGASDLARSRAGADRALRVLRATPGIHRAGPVVRFEDVHAEALLLELPVPARDLPSGAIARLAEYDAEHQSALIDTLRAWLDAFGDVAIASAAMFVHTNTFRYRLRRVAEVGGIDLDDPEARFAAMLQLRLLALTADR
ncbi:hypothetical protein LK09_09785 [Microbacterium mangrovi]|uniref:PucR family transcriptional regulator n=1 Tax=Microbacterium mangrovi TaxID=1348253 RepID=A0A0B2A8E9_9MICO|nr:PucR family transcriptional regulator [Microbacterium mangrovi]KHK97782.1 hypothetical protein LK09_09785 [Microbacterium mangrovi]